MPLHPAWLSSVPVAHRGLHDNAAGPPENSLAAFDAAAQAGYACELDVQLTSSGTLVVLHDSDLVRTSGDARPVAALTAGDLPRTRLFGSDQHVPTLAEVIDCVARRIPLLIELKSTRPARCGALVQAVLEAVRDHPGEYALSSFDPRIVYSLRAARPQLPVGQISGLLRNAPPVSRIIGRSMIGNFLTQPDFISYELAGMPSRIVESWRRRGALILAWPVESREAARKARQHADNIIFSGFRPEF
jgi:glycerophosphoryl diester phosphodiesterase